MAKITQNIPFLPENSTWENWNGNMLHFFGEEPLPYFEEARWREFAESMVSLPTFSVFALPEPDTFPDWKDWAQTVVAAVNGTTS